MLESNTPPPPAVDGGRVDARAVDFTTGGASAVFPLCVRRAPRRAQDSGLLPSLLRSAPSFSAVFRWHAGAGVERDRFRCRACGAESELLVHHRAGSNAPKILVTLCIRCHIRIHR